MQLIRGYLQLVRFRLQPHCHTVFAPVALSESLSRDCSGSASVVANSSTNNNKFANIEKYYTLPTSIGGSCHHYKCHFSWKL